MAIASPRPVRSRCSAWSRGLTNNEIAGELAISRKTANSHIEHIYTKLGVNNRARASLYAVQHGLMDDLTKMG